MASRDLAAPAHPSKAWTPAKAERAKGLRGKAGRSPAETAELVDLQGERIDALSAEVRALAAIVRRDRA